MNADIPLLNRISCRTCPRECLLAEGQAGACGARSCQDGRIVSLNYGKLTAISLDPVEKKPLARWNPGTFVLSVGSFGCNLRCPFCQNSDIARAREGDVPVREATPDEVVGAALRMQSQGCVGIAYTYNEPLVGWEFVRDTARRAHEAGLANVAVTNGMVADDVLDQVLPLLDAVNVDLKGFSAEFYAMCLGGLNMGEGPIDLGHRAFQAVRNTIARAAGTPTCHVEVTTLVVPRGETPQVLEQAARWLASVDADIPYHVTQYHPAHRWRDVRPLPDGQVREVADAARKYLHHVFTGNM